MQSWFEARQTIGYHRACMFLLDYLDSGERKGEGIGHAPILIRMISAWIKGDPKVGHRRPSDVYVFVEKMKRVAFWETTAIFDPCDHGQWMEIESTLSLSSLAKVLDCQQKSALSN